MPDILQQDLHGSKDSGGRGNTKREAIVLIEPFESVYRCVLMRVLGEGNLLIRMSQIENCERLST